MHFPFPGVALFTKKHRRSPSHYNLKYGRENSPPESPVRDISPPVSLGADILPKEGLEVSSDRLSSFTFGIKPVNF